MTALRCPGACANTLLAVSSRPVNAKTAAGHLFGKSLQRDGISLEHTGVLFLEPGINEVANLAFDGVRDAARKGDPRGRVEPLSQDADRCSVTFDDHFVHAPACAFREQETILLDET